MKKRCLGRTGLNVSEIGFGGWAIGGRSYGPVRDTDSLDALEAAWDSGVDFFDTADVYGEGHSEELLGSFLKKKPRDKSVIATKGGWDFYRGVHRKNFDRDYIRLACEKSLKRLSIETIDLYQLHNPPLKVLGEEDVLNVLESLRKEGKIRFVGVSVHTEEEALAALGDSRVHAIQVAFNLLDQRMAGKVFSEARKKGVGIIVREPLASGILSGNYPPSHEFSKDDHRRRWFSGKREADWKKIECLKKVLENKKIMLTQAALEFTLAFEAVSTVIPGAKTRTQALENAQASLQPALDHEDIGKLKELYAREEIFRKELNPR